MFESLVQTFTQHPYTGVALVFLACGLGFPLPEEVVLITAGFICFKNFAELPPMILTCAGAILAGDLIPFALGRIFGPRLLRLRPLRLLINKRRLADFDRWFRRRGDLVIFLARFMTGLRIVAYFTAGTMKMPLSRFIKLDLLGIGVVVPLLVWVGAHFGSIIDDAIVKVQRIERGVLIAAGVAGTIALLWYVLRRQRERRAALTGPSETFVGPTLERTDPTADGAVPPGQAEEAEDEQKSSP